MKLGSGIRVAIAAATLLAQLVLPVAHGLGQGGDRTSGSSPGSGAIVSASSRAARGSPHDPNQCPTCVALAHARVGVGRVLTGDFLALAGPAVATPIAPECALPRSPELATASPRAPPVLSLCFA